MSTYKWNSGTLRRSARTSRYSDSGDLTHQGTISNISDVTFPALGGANVTDLPDADTVNEITTRYDARHRPIARTVWLVPLGPVNANTPPIAGGGQPGDPQVVVNGVTQGLTTFWTYDENLTDGVGLDQQYAAQLATLGANYFGPAGVGSATAVTNPNGETSVTVMDGAGRTVMMIDGLGHASMMTYDVMVANVPGAPGPLLATTL